MGGNRFKKIRKSRVVLFTAAVLAVITAGILVAGSSTTGSRFGFAKEEAPEEYDTGFIISKPGSYDSADTAVVIAQDASNGLMTFMNIETGRRYSLSYDGTTVIKDKYGSALAMSQIKDGDIVDVLFLKNKKKLTTVQQSESAWVVDDLKKYEFDGNSKSLNIGGETFGVHHKTAILSEGKEVLVEDIVKGDVVTVRGIDRNVYSVSVDKGHGYLRLSNEEQLKGGWIEVGQSVIQQITEDMLLVVPEGSYEVHLTAGGIDETRPVTILRNQEVTLDVSDIKPKEPEKGKIVFAVTPAVTSVYIDGSEVDITKPVELEYGVHQMIAKAEGYDTITQYIKVGQALASLSVSLEKSVEGEDQQQQQQETVSGNELDTAFRVYIDAPSEVEVYLDGVYQGISPVNFKKVSGSHTITLRKYGYVTKSYTVQIDDAEKDVTYSFADLVKEEKQPTISGNKPNSDKTASGNDTASGNN